MAENMTFIEYRPYAKHEASFDPHNHLLRSHGLKMRKLGLKEDESCPKSLSGICIYPRLCNQQVCVTRLHGFHERVPALPPSTVASYPAGFVQVIVVLSLCAELVNCIHSALIVRCTPILDAPQQRDTLCGYLSCLLSPPLIMLNEPYCIHVLLSQFIFCGQDTGTKEGVLCVSSMSACKGRTEGEDLTFQPQKLEEVSVSLSDSQDKGFLHKKKEKKIKQKKRKKKRKQKELRGKIV